VSPAITGAETSAPVVALERTADDSIIAIAVVSGHDELLAPSHPPKHWSPDLMHRDGHDVRITGLAMVTDPATVGLRPLVVVPGDCRSAGPARHMAQPDALPPDAGESR
jgi:hypothetical protein